MDLPPLYHGTSSHYLSAFRLGSPPAPWPYKDQALEMLREIWKQLSLKGIYPEWHIEKILKQESGPSNWRHGEFYVTPSRISAVRYAAANCSCGGELLTTCKEGLDKIQNLDKKIYNDIMSTHEPVSKFLLESGDPILLEIGSLTKLDLSTENDDDDLERELEFILQYSGDMLEMMSQQANFRVEPGQGKIHSIYKLEIEDPDDPLPRYQMIKIDTN